MLKYAYKAAENKSAKAYGRNLDLSHKKASILCDAITGLQVDKAVALLEGMVDGRRDLHGKYYTKTAKSVLSILNNAKNNAEFKGLDSGKLHIYASGHKGFQTSTGRRQKLRGDMRKFAHVQIVLKEK